MAEKRGHWVKEGRVFIQDEDGTFLELVPTADGNFDTKPAKKEDVRGADFIEGPFDPQQAAFAGQELPSETPPAPAPPGPPMPPGYTLTAEEEQEVGASSEEAQRQAEQALADEPLSDEAGANREFFKAFYPEGDVPESGLAPEDARARLEKLEIEPRTVVVMQVPEGKPGAGRVLVFPSTGPGSYTEMLKELPQEDRDDLERQVMGSLEYKPRARDHEEPVEEEVPAEAEEEAASEEEEDEAADALDDEVEDQAANNDELAEEVNTLEGMDGRERVAYVLKNRRQFPEFNRALRSAAEQFYSDRRFRRTAVATAALGGLPEATAMWERRQQPGRENRAELMTERDRLVAARDAAIQFNAEAAQGKTELRSGIFGDLLSNAVEIEGQESRREQGRLEASAGMRLEVRLADMKQQGDELDASQKELDATYGPSADVANYTGDDLIKGRAAVVKAASKAPEGANLPDRELALLRTELTAISGEAMNPEGLQEFFGALAAYTGTDTVIMDVAKMTPKVLAEQIRGAGDAEVMAAVRRGNPELSDEQATVLADSIYVGDTQLDDPDKAEALRRHSEREEHYQQSYNELLKTSGVGKATGPGAQSSQKVIRMAGPLLDEDGRIDTRASLLQMSDIYANELTGPGGLLDAKQYDAQIADVEKSLVGAKLTPMERQIENLKKTDEGARAIRGMVGLGYTERQAAEALIADVGKRSFKKDTRDLKGALRRERRGKPREGDLDVLMAERAPQEEALEVEESPTEGVTQEVSEVPPTPAEPEVPPTPIAGARASTTPGIFEGADYTTRKQRRKKDAVMDLLRQQGLA